MNSMTVVMILTGYGFLMVAVFSNLVSALFGESIILNKGPWKIIRWHDVHHSIVSMIRSEDQKEYHGMRDYTVVRHINSECHDPVAFNKACMALYGTKQKEFLANPEKYMNSIQMEK